MAYITQSDIESVWGVGNVALWSNLDNESTTADTARIASAIVYAESELNSQLRQQFAIPLSPVDSEIVHIAAVLAGWWLYSSRGVQGDDGERIASRVRDADLRIQGIKTGTRRVTCTRSDARPINAAVVGG